MHIQECLRDGSATNTAGEQTFINKNLRNLIKTKTKQMDNFYTKNIDIPYRYVVKFLLFAQLIGSLILLTATQSSAAQPDVAFSRFMATYATDSASYNGKVINEDGSPLPGATIRLQGSRSAAISDESGSFTILSPIDGVLLISYMGYFSKELSLKGLYGRPFNVTIIRSTNILDQAQVTAYGGTTIKRYSTGNITTIKWDDIAKSPGRNILDIIQGQAPGLYIQQASGRPGSPITASIRGKNSVNWDSGPIYIVDGVTYPAEKLPYYYQDIFPQARISESLRGGNPLDYLNPALIESIDILKDADATALYGSRGAFGAILITTKKSKGGTPKISVNANTGIVSRATSPEMLSTAEYLMIRREALKNDGKTAAATDLDLNGTWSENGYTNWLKEFTGHSARVNKINASYSGGTGNLNFGLGGNYRNQNDVQDKNGSVSDAGINFNVNTFTNDSKLSLLISGTYSSTVDNVMHYDLTQGPVPVMAPNAPSLYLPSGALNWTLPGGLNGASLLNMRYRNSTNLLYSNMAVKYKPTNKLTFSTELGYNVLFGKEFTGFPSTVFNPSVFTNNSTSNLYNRRLLSIQPKLSYNDLKLGEKGILNLVAGGDLQDQVTHAESVTGSNFMSDDMINNPTFTDVALAGTTSPNITTSNVQDIRKYTGIFGTVNYNWDKKYLLNLNVRYDGSTRFADGHQFGTFGSVGAAWILSEEKWFKKAVPFLSFAKLRGSYGTTGGDGIPPYAYLLVYDPSAWGYRIYGDVTGTGTTSTTGGIYGQRALAPLNNDVHWESNLKREVQLVLGAFNDRVVLDATYYNNRNSGQYLSSSISSTSGFSMLMANVPEVITGSGYEFALNTVNISNKNFSWKSSFNITLPKNILSAVVKGNELIDPNRIVGRSIEGFSVYNYAGVDPQTGVYQFTNRNGVTAAYSASSMVKLDPVLDKTGYVDLSPSYYGGMANSLRYRSISLDFLFTFKSEVNINTLGAQAFSSGAFNQNTTTAVLGRWQKPGDVATVPKASASADAQASQTLFSQSSGAYSKSTFARMSNVYLSYDFSNAFLQKIHSSKVTLYVQASNLLTLSKSGGLDPETLNMGMPLLRNITAGLNFTL
jgi:TonB-linked SusC/RagA family outer membrane protein